MSSVVFGATKIKKVGGKGEDCDLVYDDLESCPDEFNNSEFKGRSKIFLPYLTK